MNVNSIRSVLGCLAILLLASACATTKAPVELQKPDIVEKVVVKSVPVKTPRPIVPAVDPLNLRPVNWVVLTPENVDEQFAKIKSGEAVLFAVTAEGYENMALNLSDIRAAVQQYKQVIAVYERSYN